MKKQIGLLLLFSICLSSSLIGQVRDATLRQLVKQDLRYAIFGKEGALQSIETKLTNPEAKISGILHPKISEGVLRNSILSLEFKATIDEDFISVFSKNEFNNTLSLKFRWDFIPFIKKINKKKPFNCFIKYKYSKVAMLGIPEMIEYKQEKDTLLFDSLVVLGFLVHTQIDTGLNDMHYLWYLKKIQASRLYIKYAELFNKKGKIKNKIATNFNNGDRYKKLLDWAYGKYLTLSIDTLASNKTYKPHNLGKLSINLKTTKISKQDKAKILNRIFELDTTTSVVNDTTYFIINRGDSTEAIFKIKIEVDSLILKYKSVEDALKNYDKKIVQYEIEQAEAAWTKKKIVWFSANHNFQVSSFSYGNASLLTQSIDSINIVDSFSIDVSLDLNIHYYENWQNFNLYMNFGVSPGFISNKNSLQSKDYSRSLSTTDTIGSINTVYGQTKNGTMYHGELLQGLGLKLSFNFICNFTKGVLSPGIFFKQEATFSSIFKTTNGIFLNTEVGLVFNFLDREKKSTYVSLVPYIGITNAFMNVKTSNFTDDNKEYQPFGDKYLIGIKVGIPIHFKPNKNKVDDLKDD
jgi:hypothetical protein